MEQGGYLEEEEEAIKRKNEKKKHQQHHGIQLSDSFGRIARKLRVSVTNRCNLRCVYCMPSHNVEWVEKDSILSYEEITRLTTVFVSLGINKMSYRWRTYNQASYTRFN